MTVEDPVANVDGVNVLFDDDVAGEHAIVNPIAQTAFDGRRVWPRGPVNVGGPVVGFARNDFAERACMDAADHFNKGRTLANLEPHVEVQLSIDAFADFKDFHCAGNVDGYRLLKINV